MKSSQKSSSHNLISHSTVKLITISNFMLRDWRQWRVVRHTLSAATRRMSTKSIVKDKEKRSKTSELPWRFSDPISESDLPPNRSGILTQWRNLKMQIPAQFVLLLQVGSFYEIIHNDAIRVANAVEPPLHVASRTYSAGKTPLKTVRLLFFVCVYALLSCLCRQRDTEHPQRTKVSVDRHTALSRRHIITCAPPPHR